MSEEDLLRNIVYDAIAEGRHTLRATYAKPAPAEGATFYVSFVVTVDAKTHTLLGAIAAKKERTIPRLIRRYVKECFQMCICEDEDELKAA